MNFKAYLSEAIGTFFLVFIGTGAIVVHELYQNTISHLGISAAFGLIVGLMIFTFARNSGAHFNPAVSMVLFLCNKLSKKDLIPYVLSQCFGAVLASTCILFIFSEHHSFGLTQPSDSWIQSFTIEILCTFLLMFVILQVVYGNSKSALEDGAAIGAMVALCALFAGPVSGASMNPARSLGPAIISGNLDFLWLYVTAPVLGALLSFFVCRFSHSEDCCQ